MGAFIRVVRHGAVFAGLVVTLLGLAACGGGGGGGGDGGVTPSAPEVTLGYGIKQLQFSWDAVAGATHYQLLENPDGASGYSQVGSDISATSVDHAIALYRRVNASYIVSACNSAGCTDSAAIFLAAQLVPAIGYVKASNAGEQDQFGGAVALSADGTTLAVGAFTEDSAATDIDGDEADDSASASGAVYVFTRSAGTWSQQAYVKASNTDAGDWFGYALALSADGDTLAVGAYNEDSADIGIDGDEADNSALSAGAVYVFTRSAGTWSQQAYVKASNTGADDAFGYAVALSADGDTLAVGAYSEDSAAIGVDGDQASNTASNSGAVYVFTRSAGAWSQQAYVKASNTGANDWFGYAVALSADGTTLAVGAHNEDSAATGIDGIQTDNSKLSSGAVYVFTRSGVNWSQQAYVKASNTGADDWFGRALALSADGSTLAVGAQWEDSNATGIGGEQFNESASNSGAAYVFTRSAGSWSQQAYVKASNAGADDVFGGVLALSADGDTLAVGAYSEDSNATGIDGDQAINTAANSGAVYVFTRSAGSWSQRAYVKASNTGSNDWFGFAVALSGDGTALAVAARNEASNATGVCASGDSACATAQANNAADGAGAVYLY